MKILKGMIFLILLISHFSHASFQLETMTVILDSEEPRKIFNVKNTVVNLFYYQQKSAI